MFRFFTKIFYKDFLQRYFLKMQFFNKYFLKDFYDENFGKSFFMKILENFMMKFLIFFIIKLLIFYWDFLRGTVEGRMSKMRKNLLKC